MKKIKEEESHHDRNGEHLFPATLLFARSSDFFLSVFCLEPLLSLSPLLTHRQNFILEAWSSLRSQMVLVSPF